jgi:hypothetical protein
MNAGHSRIAAAAPVVLFLLAQNVGTGLAADSPRLITHQGYVEETARATELPLGNIKDMFGWVLGNLPDLVKVYPTENYYYFRFMHNGQNYAGNIRLDAADRDTGKVHFAYFEDMSEYRTEPLIQYRVLDKQAGVSVEKVERFLYRVSYQDKSVLFELNDLSKVVPPPEAISSEETYIGPVFDDSAIRFFLVFNNRLKIFHYVLDETVKVNDEFLGMRDTDRILIGKRTGFAYYRDNKLDRKILIGVFEANARVNNYFDGPFDQLPDNFIEGDVLRDALIAASPSLAGTIDRYGHSANGSRVSISPYTYYRTEADLLPFYNCANDPALATELYYACFVMDMGWDDGKPGIWAYKWLSNTPLASAPPDTTYAPASANTTAAPENNNTTNYYNPNTYNPNAYNQTNQTNPTNYNPYTYNQNTYNPNTYNPNTYNQTNPTTYNPYVYSPHTYDPNTYNPNTYNQTNPTTYSPNYYNPNAYNPNLYSPNTSTPTYSPNYSPN